MVARNVVTTVCHNSQLVLYRQRITGRWVPFHNPGTTSHSEGALEMVLGANRTGSCISLITSRNPGILYKY